MEDLLLQQQQLLLLLLLLLQCLLLTMKLQVKTRWFWWLLTQETVRVQEAAQVQEAVEKAVITMMPHLLLSVRGPCFADRS